MSLPSMAKEAKRTTKKSKDFVDKVLQWTQVTYAGSIQRRLHDAKSRDGECAPFDGQDIHGDVDGYGFERFPSSSGAKSFGEVTELRRVLDACMRREKIQKELWSRVDMNTLVGDEGIKRLCRGGVPPEFRKQVWCTLSGAYRTKQYYEHVLGMKYNLYIERGKSQRQCVKQIDLDVPRTFPNNQWIQSSVGQVSLQRVLYAFSGIHQEIGYCQGMNYIAAMLLIVLEYDEEMAFWTMTRLIGHDGSHGILYENVHASTLSGCHVEMRSLETIVAKKLPKLAHHMGVIECDFSMVSTEWFLCLFATSLPPETVARVWDILFCEGPKILYRIALAILKTHEDELLATENSGDLLKTLHVACAFEFDRDALVAVACQDIGHLSMSWINTLRDEKQFQVDQELALRETKEKLRAAVEEHGHVLLEATGEEDLLNTRACDLDVKQRSKLLKSPLFIKKYFKQRM